MRLLPGAMVTSVAASTSRGGYKFKKIQETSYHIPW